MTCRGSVGGDERLRLFCGLPLPAPSVARLAEWQRDRLTAGRIVPPANLHVTLAFLGSLPASDLEAVAGALREAAATAGRPLLAVRGYRETRSVGMLVLADEDGRAGGVLAERLHERLEQLGLYERERRPWLPHITVLRFRRPPRLDPGLPDLGGVSPSDAAVFLSRLHPSGARYEVLEYVPLGG
jgi:RNA 2',3'-cyclic 3'-phosphodiesterase